jgi:hypothetical protein
MGWPAIPRLALHGGKVSFFFRISGVQCRGIVAKQITQNPVRGSRNEYQWNLRERQAPLLGLCPACFMGLLRQNRVGLYDFKDCGIIAPQV